MPLKAQEPGRPLIFCHSSKNIATSVPDTLSAALASASLYYPQLRQPLRLTIDNCSRGPIELTESAWSTTLIQGEGNLKLFLNVVEATEDEEADYNSRTEQDIGLDSDSPGLSEATDGSGDSDETEKVESLGDLGHFGVAGSRANEAFDVGKVTLKAHVRAGGVQTTLLIKVRRTTKFYKLRDAIAEKAGVNVTDLKLSTSQLDRFIGDGDTVNDLFSIGDETMEIHAHSVLNNFHGSNIAPDEPAPPYH